MRLCRPAKGVRLHPPPGNPAQTRFLAVRVYGEEIETCFRLGA